MGGKPGKKKGKDGGQGDESASGAGGGAGGKKEKMKAGRPANVATGRSANGLGVSGGDPDSPHTPTARVGGKMVKRNSIVMGMRTKGEGSAQQGSRAGADAAAAAAAAALHAMGPAEPDSPHTPTARVGGRPVKRNSIVMGMRTGKDGGAVHQGSKAGADAAAAAAAAALAAIQTK
jgi:hypothetical protein